MPTLNGAGANVTKENTHTDREALRRSVGYGFHASMKTCMVAQLVKNKDILKSSDARDAADKEWHALEKRKCWDLDKVVKWSDVKKRAIPCRRRLSLRCP